jgi:hypothetical protein
LVISQNVGSKMNVIALISSVGKRVTMGQETVKKAVQATTVEPNKGKFVDL